MTRQRFATIITLLLILLPLNLEAANFVLKGVVYDSDGEPVPHATVTVRDTKHKCAASGEGAYLFELPAGEYTVEASAIGYEPASHSVSLKKNTTLDITIRESGYTLEGVNVTGKTNSRKLAESAFAVNAIDMKSDINRLTTVKDIIDRTSGVKVRREGGVGSDYDLSINGLSGNSIRYFIDGVPLDSKGSGFTLENVPVNTVERVELFKGVVPSYLGADALGGAVNIVTRHKRNNYLDASYGIGSFHTQSADVTGQYYIPGTHIAIKPTFSFSKSKNDYMMHGVRVWDEDADKYILTDKRRFHDDYLSMFAQIEAGVNDVTWADAFSVVGSFSKVNKDIQTGATQSKVYGDAERKSRSWSIGARYRKRFGGLGTRLDITHTWDRNQTIDTAFRKYSWDGTWIPSTGNEINNRTRSIRVYNRPLTVVSAGADYIINENHNIALDYMMDRRGNRRHDNLDKNFEVSNDVVTKHILSLTYSQEFLDGRLQNSYFVKDYINHTEIQQTDDATITGADKIKRENTRSYYGAGLGSRYTILVPLSVKASYEHSVRLPLSREMLGNGLTVYPNLALAPESSNNYNLGLFGTWHINSDNTMYYEANGYIRHVQNYIRAVVSERDGMMQYVNEPAIEVKGIDFDLNYHFRNSLEASVNFSYSDARNLRRLKPDGNPSATYRNRVPNRPWMFANTNAAYSWHSLIQRSDNLRLGMDFQWIHWYYLNWEAYGAKESKAKIPTQCLTDITLGYSWHSGRYNLTFEFSNVFNRLAYDNYMLQKPGRAFNAKFRLFLE